MNSLRLILLPWFVLRLSFASLPSMLRLITGIDFSFKSLVFTLCLLAWVCFSLYFSYGKTRAYFGTTPTLPTPFSPDKTQLNEDLQSWLKLYKLQPTHRDVLLNIANLYSQLGDQEQANNYVQQARQVDPNYALIPAE